MKTIILLTLITILQGCGLANQAYKNGRYVQDYIDSKNYPLIVTRVVWDEDYKDFKHYIKDYGFTIHLPDSFAAGTALVLTAK